MKVQERFLKYISVWTTSDDYSKTIPSSQRQFDLAYLLEKEMKEMGLSEVGVDENGYVYGILPATPGYEKCPSVAFLAHMDTSPEFSGENVKPQIIENYDGEDIVLGESGRTICVAEFPYLKEWKGRTVITTDGTTLLGADDKAGIAEALTACEQIMAEGKPHGKVCFSFTVDEEIGSGAEELNLERLGAKYGYTIDGDIEGEIQFENFNASYAFVDTHGVSVHPGSAKDIMKNSQEIAMEFHSMLPAHDKPQHTEGYEGFYHLIEMKGNVSESKLVYLIRDFDMESYKSRQQLMKDLAAELNEKYDHCIDVRIEESYLNMKEEIKPCMWIVDVAKKATEMAGVATRVTPIRGGTDGARLSFRGLPCPNLGGGGNGFHGPYEHVSVEGMEATVKVVKNIVALFAEKEDE